MSMVIKKFSELNVFELYKILQFRSEIFVVEQKCIYQDVDDKDFKSWHLMYYVDEKLVGYLRIVEKNVSYPEISIGRVIVKKSERRNKTGEKIMKNAIQFIENKLYEKEIRISAQAYLINFYESLGFQIVSEPYLEDDIPHIEMLKKL